MKILLVDVVCKQGSTGKIVYDLYTCLNNNGEQAYVCYGRGRRIRENGIYKIGSTIEMLLDGFLTKFTGINGRWSFFSTLKLKTIIEKIKPDIVHIHDPKTYYLNYFEFASYLKKKHIPTVWTFHSEFMYTGKCGYAFSCDKWKSECGNCPFLSSYVGSWFFDFTHQMFKKKKQLFFDWQELYLVLPSKWIMNRAKDSFLFDKKMTVINNGIDTSVFRFIKSNNLRNSWEIPDNKKIVLGVAPNIMQDRKGGKYFFQLANILKDENIVFVVVGFKKDELQQLSFPENMIPLEETNDQLYLSKCYCSADLFVICSSMENFPTTCVEAGCCGLPIAGFNVGGVKETALPEYSGFVDYGDIKSLINQIMLLINDENINDKRKISEINTNRFSRENMFNNYYRLYKKILEER